MSYTAVGSTNPLLALQQAVAKQTAEAKTDPRYGMLQVGTPCVTAEWTASKQKSSGRKFTIGINGKCMEAGSKEMIADITSNEGKPCGTKSKPGKWRSGVCQVNKGVKCGDEKTPGVYDEAGLCVPQSSLSKPTLTDPAAAKKVEQAAVAETSTGIPPIVLVGGGLVALFFVVKMIRRKS